MSELSVLLKMKDEMSRQLDAAKGKLGGFSGALKGMGIGIAAGGAALVGLGAAAIKSGADFEAGMREVNTMIGLNEEQFQNLSQQVLDLSSEVGKGGDELADALYQAVSAGVPASEAINMIRTSAQAAVGGVTDVTTATDGLTTVLNAFKIPASEAGMVADVMFTTVKGGKCLVGSTRVLMADGRYESIDNLSTGGDVVSYDGRTFQTMPAQWVDQGVKETVRVRTRLGREITTTWNHPYLSIPKEQDIRSTKRPTWRLVREIRVGDSIAVPTALPYFGPNAVPEYEAALLGLWIAEGAGKNSTPRLTTNKYEGQLKQWASQYGCEVKNLEKRPGKTPTYSLTTGKRNGGRISNPIYAMLTRYGIADCISGDKHIPKAVFSWNRASVSMLLRWLFNGDGWFQSKTNGRSKCQIGFVSKSETLVRDVSHLLLRYGIVGRIRNRGNCFVWETDRYFEVQRFIEFIGIDRPGTETIRGTIPQKEKARWGVVEYDPVVAIEPSGTEHVYDLVVPHLHNFVANDIIAHNTTFEELSASMFNVAPIAAAAGVSFEEVAGAIATVTKQGVPTSVATTQLRAAIQAILKPTADMKTALTDLGYASGDAMLAELGFQGTLDTLVTAAGGSTEAMGLMFGSVEGMSAVLSLTGDNAKTFAADLENSMNAAGAATDAYNEVNKGAGRQFEMLQEKVQALMAELGTQLLPLLTPLIDGFMKLIDSLPIDEIGELLSNLLPPLVDALMSLLDALPIDGFIKLVESALKPTFAILGKVMGAIPTDAFNALLDALTPIIDVLGEIILLIPIEPFLELVGILVKDLAPILRLVATILDTILKPVLQLVFFLLEKIMDVLGPVLEGVGKVIGWVAGGLGKAANAVGGFFGNLFGGATGAIVTSPTLAMIGEAGPEAVVPLSSAPGASALSGFGGGQTTINITVQGSVLSENDLVETVRSGLIRTGRANVSALGAFA